MKFLNGGRGENDLGAKEKLAISPMKECLQRVKGRGGVKGPAGVK